MNEEMVRDTKESISQPGSDSQAAVHQVVEGGAQLPDAVSAAQKAGSAEQAPQALRSETPPLTVNPAELPNGRIQTTAEILDQLAESATSFIRAVQELVRQSAGSGSELHRELDRQQSNLDKLAGIVSAQQTSISTSQEQYTQLSAAVTSVQEVSQRHRLKSERCARRLGSGPRVFPAGSRSCLQGWTAIMWTSRGCTRRSKV